jgi:hypothetical protein
METIMDASLRPNATAQFTAGDTATIALSNPTSKGEVVASDKASPDKATLGLIDSLIYDIEECLERGDRAQNHAEERFEAAGLKLIELRKVYEKAYPTMTWGSFIAQEISHIGETCEFRYLPATYYDQ